MSRKLASVVRVAKVSDILNSDNLSVAEMEDKGWRVVVSRGSLRAGDLAVYFEIDSALPVEDSRYGFLKQRCLKEFKRGNEVVLSTLRIKTVKLRGVISQGLLLPLADFPELSRCGIGADVSSILHIEHYDELAAPFRHEHGVFVARSESRGGFPSYIPKTDEERIQNLVEYFETMKGRRFEVTSKDDGTSMTVYYAPSLHEEDPFRVCSRNQDLKRSDENSLWKIANAYPKTEGPDLPEIMMLKPHGEYIVGEDGIHHKVEPKTVEEYRLRYYTGNFLRDRRVWCDELLRWDFGSSFDVLIDRYSLNPCFWKRSSILLTKDVARKMLVAAEYILGGVWDDRMSLVAKNEFVKLFTDGYNCTSYWKYLNRHAIEANQKVFEFENEGCKVIVKLPDRKRRSNGSYTRADAECDEEIECWLRNIASATRAYLESDEYSYNDEHELLLEYRCWG